MNANARAIADSFHADDGDTLHIYDDGYIVVVACSADRHLVIRDVLKKKWSRVEEARSSNGFLSVFMIFEEVPWVTKPDADPLLLLLASGASHDHRQEDHHTIEFAIELLGE